MKNGDKTRADSKLLFIIFFILNKKQSTFRKQLSFTDVVVYLQVLRHAAKIKLSHCACGGLDQPVCGCGQNTRDRLSESFLCSYAAIRIG